MTDEEYLRQFAHLTRLTGGPRRDTRPLRERQEDHLKAVRARTKSAPEDCLHNQCTECHGTGIRSDGLRCIHSIVCPCASCRPTCLIQHPWTGRAGWVGDGTPRSRFGVPDRSEVGGVPIYFGANGSTWVDDDDVHQHVNRHRSVTGRVTAEEKLRYMP